MPRNLIEELPGPILVIGASGFIGANLLHAVLAKRTDVIGTFFSGNSWRLHNIPTINTIFLNLHDPISVQAMLMQHKPKVIFDCSSFGAYSFERDYERIHETNYTSFINLIEKIDFKYVQAYIHAGSSSEYGLNSAAPAENTEMIPNSHYAVSKASVSNAIAYYGKVRKYPIVNLRLYSVYGPYEDSARLIPVLCDYGARNKLPTFAPVNVSRDFIHVDDVLSAFTNAAMLANKVAGESFNIGSGRKSTITDLARLAKKIFHIDADSEHSQLASRSWDTNDWYANPRKARDILGWMPSIGLEEGLIATSEWWNKYLANHDFTRLTKKGNAAGQKRSISAVVACYCDNEAIPLMHKRLTDVFIRLGIDYEIILVNDCSPDDSEERIRAITATDPHVIGITHSRNFGSQAAFKSGMEICSKEACVLLDGDLQDPPEMIEEFVKEWRNGADVVYGRRVKREMPRWLDACYKAFYRVFSFMSEIPVPENAGDFSLMDRSVVFWLLQCKERDFFLRGLRAYVGFKQVGVDYVRPERVFGRSTNNWIKNIGWAKKAIF
ncbi:MAG: NAD-dependent epimerase/dehydratase family protein [Parabacteroides sp.]|nr:NAD-dependent epimerase/dehydratase family protein [Parabacteroides sp.]